VPLARDPVEVLVGVGEPPRHERPDALPAAAIAADETRVREHLEVLGDRLTRDARPDAQAYDRARTAGGQAAEQAQPGLVAERREEWGRVPDARGRAAASLRHGA